MNKVLGLEFIHLIGHEFGPKKLKTKWMRLDGDKAFEHDSGQDFLDFWFASLEGVEEYGHKEVGVRHRETKLVNNAVEDSKNS